MAGRHIALRTVVDGLLLTVPSVLLLFVISRHVLRIGLEWSFDPRGAADGDVLSLALTVLYVMCLIGGLIAMRLLSRPPLRVTSARLLLILLLTLFAIALAAVDRVYVAF